MQHKEIGQLNGPWSILLRIALASWPPMLVVVVTWGIWVTKNQFEDKAFRESGDRFTQMDGAALKAEVYERLAAQPPPEWRERIIRIETAQLEIIRGLTRIEERLKVGP